MRNPWPAAPKLGAMSPSFGAAHPRWVRKVTRRQRAGIARPGRWHSCKALGESAQVSPRVVFFLGRFVPARTPNRFLVRLLDLRSFLLLLLLGLVRLGLAGILLGVNRHRQQRDYRSHRS